MKKIIGMLLLSVFLFGESSLIKIVEKKTKKELNLESSYSKILLEKTTAIWDSTITETGNVRLRIIIKSRKGKVKEIVIVNKTKEKLFKEELDEVIKKIKELRFKRMKTDSGTITAYMDFSFKKFIPKTIDPISIYKDNSKLMYPKYINFLINIKSYNLEFIKKMLHTEKKTVTKMMLMAMHYDYNEDDLEEAGRYYDIVINTKIQRFVNKIEGLFLVDYLLREKEYDLILEILPQYSCYYMKSPEKEECYYFRGHALYYTENPEYIFALTKTKGTIPQVDILLKKIEEDKKEERKK